MNEDDDARLAKAAMKSIRVSAPESLKADLKRLARNRKQAPSIWAGLRESISGGAWAYGAGAAFASAAVGAFILHSVPAREPAVKPATVIETVAPQALSDLWSDDDGEDNDEI